MNFCTSISHYTSSSDWKKEINSMKSRNNNVLCCVATSWWSEQGERESEITRFSSTTWDLVVREDIPLLIRISRGKYIHVLCLFANDFCGSMEDRRLEETRTLASLNLYCKHTFEISLPPLGKLPPLLSLIFLLLLFIIEESCDPLMNFPHGRWSCLQTNNIFSFLSYEISGK